MPVEDLVAYYQQAIAWLIPIVDTLRSYLPQVLWFVISVIILTIVGRLVVLGISLRRSTVILKLTPPANTNISGVSTAQLFRLIHGLSDHRSWLDRFLFRHPSYSFEIVSRKEAGIQYLLQVPTSHAPTIEKTLRGYLPGLKIEPTTEYLPSRLSGKVIEFGLRQHFAYPLQEQTDLAAHDPIAYLTNSMTQLAPDELIALQLVLRPIGGIADSVRGREITTLKWKHRNNLLKHPHEDLQSSLIKNVFSGLLNVIKSLLGLVVMVIEDHSQSARTAAQARTQTLTALPVEVPISASDQQLTSQIGIKLEQPLFICSVRALVLTEPKLRRSRVQGLIASFASFTSHHDQALRAGWSLLPFLKRWQFRKRLLPNTALVLAPDEIAGLYHFPITEKSHTEDLVRNRSPELPAPLSFKQAAPQFDNIFATNIYAGKETSIGLTLEERRRHTYIIGATGSGKTTLLATMIHQDIVNGKGVAVVDPHGQLVEQILRTIPTERMKDVVWFAPDDDGFPIALNLLDLPNVGEGELTPSQLQKQKSLVVSSITSIFKKFYDAKYFGPRMETLLRNAVLAVLETPQPTLVTILDLLTKQDVRREIVSRLPAGVVKDYWEYEFNKLGSLQRNQTISPITNKIGGILSSPLNYNILSQPTSKLDFDDVMNSGKILLCDLSKGKIGEDESSFFGSLVIAKLQLAALRRARIPETDRHDFFLYVDEFQNFATDSFKELVSEARKYRLSTILAHQSISQVENRDIIQTILANVGTVICFRTANPEDERFILPIFSPEVSKYEIANLALYHCYMKVSVGAPQASFMAEINNFTAEPSEATAHTAMTASRAHYAVAFGELPQPGVAVVSQSAAAETATSIRFNTIDSFTSIPIQERSKVGNGKIKISSKLPTPPLTNKQHEILHLLARYRFLTRTHIQQLLHHQHHKTIQDWLNDLTTKQYLIRKDPKTETNAKTTAIYHLATKAISYLKGTEQYNTKSLTKLYREHDRSAAFIQRSLLIADIALDLRDRPRTPDKTAVILPLEYQYSPLSSELAKLSPHAVVLCERDKQLEPFFVDIVDDLPPKILTQQLQGYIDIFDTNVWQVKMNTPFPTILLIGLNKPALKTTTAVIKKLLKQLDVARPLIRLTTRDKVKEGGLLGNIWQDLTESPRNAK